MKNYLLLFGFLFATQTHFSQSYQFTNVLDLEANPVISQGATGTCWSFSTTSFLESEIIRLTGKRIDLSEMYSVRNTYPKKASIYIMRQGKAQFGEGGLAHDVLHCVSQFGLVPQEAFSGKAEENSSFNHTEMVAVLEGMLKTYVDNSARKLSPQWKDAFSAVLDVYIGKNITEFTYEGKKYTPKSFLEITKIIPENYVTLTSFTNEKYYDSFILSVPDNFSNGSMYNLPLNEYLENIDHALENGYTLSLDCDVSENTFSGNKGLAVIAENDTDAKVILTEIKTEKEITAQYRQEEFENLHTQDDHLMHIVGKVKDQNGKIYFKVKNSWGAKTGQNGFVYMSTSYIKLKSISVLVHKDGLTKKTKSALGI